MFHCQPWTTLPERLVKYSTLKFPPQSNISCCIYYLSTYYVNIKLGCVSNDDECCFKIIICIVVCMTSVYHSPKVHTYCEAYHGYNLLKYVLLNKSTWSNFEYMNTFNSIFDTKCISRAWCKTVRISTDVL